MYNKSTIIGTDLHFQIENFVILEPIDIITHNLRINGQHGDA